VGETDQLAATDPTSAVLEPPPAPPGPAVPEPAPVAAPQVLRSEQLRRLADRAAAALALPTPTVDHEQALPAEALARVLDAVEASTAATKRRTAPTGTGSPPGPGAGGSPRCRRPRRPGALRHRGRRRADRRRALAVRPRDADPLGRVDQSGAHRRRAGCPRPVRGGPPRAVGDPADPRDTAEPPGAAAVDGVRRRAPPLRTGRAHPGRRRPPRDGRAACPAAAVEDRPGGPRHSEGPAVRAGPGPARPAPTSGGDRSCTPGTPPPTAPAAARSCPSSAARTL